MPPRLPPVTKALLIANAVVFVVQLLLPASLLAPLQLRPFVAAAPLDPLVSFMPWQLVTHAFMHADPLHIVLNMLAVFMFGTQLEYHYGPRRYLQLYAISVLGAGVCQLVVSTIVLQQGGPFYTTLGASGGVFGLLVAYGMTFPNQRVSLVIPPITMKARTMVIVFIVVQLVFAVGQVKTNEAHFAHLGGALFGWLVVRAWRGQPPFGRRPKPPQARRRDHLRIVP